MRIGITFDLKTDDAADGPIRGEPAGATVRPDDWQEEFDSPVTIEAIAGVFRSLGHEVVWLGDGREMLRKVLAEPPDFVFNLAEGHGTSRCREARVPAVLEMLGIPFSGSDALTLSVCLDKDYTKKLVKSPLIKVPRGCVFAIEDDLEELHTRDWLPWPAIVKPVWEGSSKGIRGKCVVESVEEAITAVEALRRAQQQPVLFEEYIEGDELTVAVMGNQSPQVMGVMQITPVQSVDRFVYSLEVKRDFRRQVNYECPPKLPPARIEAVNRAALAAYQSVGCRDLARIDFRLGRDDREPYFIEINPLPGLNPESSDLVIMMGLLGWSYDRLIRTILEAAFRRCGLACEPSILPS